MAALGSLLRNSDDDVVTAWTELLAAALEQFLLSPQLGSRLIALAAQLYVDSQPASIDDLLFVAMAGMSDLDPDAVRADPQLSRLAQAFAVPVNAVLGQLVDVDAATLDNDQVTLTDLGRYGLGRWFAHWGISAPTVTDLADASAGEMLDLGVGLEDREQVDALFSDWVSARGAEVAAADLVDYARGGTPSHRVMVFDLLNDIGAPAEKAVRSAVDDKDLGPHAKAWLAVADIEDIQPTLDDLQRLFIEMVAMNLEDGDALPDLVAQLGSDSGPEHTELIGSLWECDHADTVQVLELLATHHPEPAAVKAAQKAFLRARSNQVSSGQASTAGRKRPPTKSTVAARSSATYELKVTLMHTEPPIWRRVRVPGSVRLPQLHAVIQTAMGWTDSHLHEFEIDGMRYGNPDPNYGGGVISETKVKLAEVAGEGDRLEYTYDFGDGWLHEVLVEKILPTAKGKPKPKPACLDGGRACPPEDIGGPPGFAEFLEAYGDPAHEDHQHYHEWVGDNFDPLAFDADKVTGYLRQLRVR